MDAGVVAQDKYVVAMAVAVGAEADAAVAQDA